MVNWAITGGCNSKCIFCEAPQLTTQRDLPLERVTVLIDEMAALGIKNVHLVGGEPFVRKDIWSILSYLKGKNIKITITSNATFAHKFSPEQLRIIKDTVSLMRISLDSTDRERCDEIRGLPGTFDHILSSLKIYKELKSFPLSITTVVMKENVSEIPKICELASRYNIDYVEFQPVSPISIFKDTPPLAEKNRFLLNKEEEFRELASRINEGIELSKILNINTNLPLFKLYALPYFRVLTSPCSSLFQRDIVRSFKCIKIHRSIFIDYDGSCRPCSVLNLGKDGDLKTSGLRLEWEKMKKFREEMDKGKIPLECRYCFCHTGENIKASVLLSPIRNRDLLFYLFNNGQI